jgi:hypothetical protein
MDHVTGRVPAAARCRPEMIEPAYDDPDAILRLVQEAEPYPNLVGMAGYAGFECRRCRGSAR